MTDDRGHEQYTVLERKELSARQVHEALRLEGKEELERGTKSLFWSGLGCGITLGLSQVPFTTYVGRFLVPVLLGNTVGGFVLVAALNHAQVAADEPFKPADSPLQRSATLSALRVNAAADSASAKRSSGAAILLPRSVCG